MSKEYPRAQATEDKWSRPVITASRSRTNHARVRNGFIASTAVLTAALAGGNHANAHDANLLVCQVPVGPQGVGFLEKQLGAVGHTEKVFNADGTPNNSSDYLIPAGSILSIEQVDPAKCMAIGGQVLGSTIEPPQMK